MELRKTNIEEATIANKIIAMAKRHLKEQGIDQWQQEYPDEACIRCDILSGKGYFALEDGQILGYLCVDFDGDPSYDDLRGHWNCDAPYGVVHRMALDEKVRGAGISSQIFQQVEHLCQARGVRYIRIDTDEGNQKMQHILRKNGYVYCGIVMFECSEKLAFDKVLIGATFK